MGVAGWRASPGICFRCGARAAMALGRADWFMPSFYQWVLLQLHPRSGAEGSKELPDMCDYSLHTAKSRPARVGARLVTRNFNTGTRGFAAPEDGRSAVCVLPGTELAFDKELQSGQIGLFGLKVKTIEHT